MAYEFELIKVVQRGRVATVTIDNPPVNVITMALFAELIALSTALKADPDLTVVVIRSADPDFFLAHFDVTAILDRPVGFEPQRDVQLKPFHALCEDARMPHLLKGNKVFGRQVHTVNLQVSKHSQTLNAAVRLVVRGDVPETQRAA